MEWGITSLDELQKMKEKLDRGWSEIFEENPSREEEIGRWIERLPKFGGTRRPLKLRSKIMIKSY